MTLYTAKHAVCLLSLMGAECVHTQDAAIGFNYGSATLAVVRLMPSVNPSLQPLSAHGGGTLCALVLTAPSMRVLVVSMPNSACQLDDHALVRMGTYACLHPSAICTAHAVSASQHCAVWEGGYVWVPIDSTLFRIDGFCGIVHAILSVLCK